MRSVEVRNHKKDAAVSPVVGVMLMLVVTIVIAAVVAMFATGVFSETKTASTAVIELVDDKPLGSDGADDPTYWLSNMKFAHKGGDVLNVDELTLKVTYDGETVSNNFNSIKTDSTKTTWSVGEKLEVKILPEPGLGPSVIGTTSYYTWSITDGSGLVIASGTKYFDFNGDTEIPVTAITISGDDSVNVGGSITLTASVSPDDATVKTVSWSSLNTNVATVNSDGVVTGVMAGSTTITAAATDGSGISDSIDITVEAATQEYVTVGLNSDNGVLFDGNDGGSVSNVLKGSTASVTQSGDTYKLTFTTQSGSTVITLTAKSGYTLGEEVSSDMKYAMVADVKYGLNENITIDSGSMTIVGLATQDVVTPVEVVVKLEDSEKSLFVNEFEEEITIYPGTAVKLYDKDGGETNIDVGISYTNSGSGTETRTNSDSVLSSGYRYVYVGDYYYGDLHNSSSESPITVSNVGTNIVIVLKKTTS